MIAVVAAAYFLFIQEETQIPEQIQQEENIYTKEYGNKKVFAIEPAEKNKDIFDNGWRHSIVSPFFCRNIHF